MNLEQNSEQRGGGRKTEEEVQRVHRGEGRSRRRAVSEGGGCEEKRRLRWRINQLEKDKLLLNSGHNQEVCQLEAELTHLRSALEHSEAQGAELHYRLTVCFRDKRSLAEHLQQDVEERDQMLRSCGAENQQLRQVLEEQEGALQEADRRREELQREREEEKRLLEEKERSCREKEEVLRSWIREERERRSSTQHALQHLQAKHKQCQSDLRVAVETHHKMSSNLEEEARGHAHTHTLLQQALQAQQETQDIFLDVLTQISQSLEPHGASAKHDGKPAEVVTQLRATLKMFEQKTERLQEENQSLTELNSQLKTHLLEVQQKVATLKEEVTCLQNEASDWSSQTRELQEEMERREKEEMERREKEEMERREKEEMERREKEEMERREKEEMERREKEEMERREKEEMERRAKEVRDQREKVRKDKEVEERRKKKEEKKRQEETTRLSFLYSLYQRLLAGCVLLHQPHSMLGNFTWQELCDVITEQVEQLISDLRVMNDKATHLQRVCNKKSVCVRELQCRHKSVLSRLEESVKKRDEAWRRRHTYTLSQLQLCRSQCDRLTSDLSESRNQAASFRVACVLLGGALSHTHRQRLWLCQQKALLKRRLEEREHLEREVRLLASALGGEEEERKRIRSVAWRWRRSVFMLLAVRRWMALGRRSNVLFQLEGGAPTICVCGDGHQGEDEGDDDDGCARWLRSARLSSALLSSVSNLQAALQLPGSTHLIPAARSALSRLLQHVVQSDEHIPSQGGRQEGSPANTKALVSALHQHFLLFSQRLHSAEVERRSLRLELASHKRGQQQEEMLSEVRRELRRKECSLRIVGRHLLEVQREREEACRRLDRLISCLKAGESSCQQVKDSLVQSWRSPTIKPHPLPSLWKHLELFAAESMMGNPEVEVCQSFLSTVSQLVGCCCSRIGWLEQEVSAHRSHVVI